VCFIPLSQCLVLTSTCLFCVFYTPVTMFSIDCSTCLFWVYYTPVTMFSIDCSTCLFWNRQVEQSILNLVTGIIHTKQTSGTVNTKHCDRGIKHFGCIIPLSQCLVLTVPLVCFVCIIPVTRFSIDCSTCLFCVYYTPVTMFSID
jgi:hypothetical protein